MSTFEVYLWLKLDDFIAFLLICGLLGTIIIPLIYLFVSDSTGEYKHKKKVILATMFFLMFIMIGFLMPSTKQAAAIYVMPKILTENNINTLNEDAKEIYNLGIETIKNELKQEEKTLDNSK